MKVTVIYYELSFNGDNPTTLNGERVITTKEVDLPLRFVYRDFKGKGTKRILYSQGIMCDVEDIIAIENV
jgi:hypothetical protein